MKLLIDTDVLIDHLARREPYAHDIRTLCIAAYFGDVELWATTQSYIDALYCLRKYASQRNLRDAALGTLAFVRPCGMRADDLKPALESSWPDAEDFLIARCAQNVGADYLLTRDAAGFGKSAIPTLSPREAVSQLEQQGLNYNEIICGTGVGSASQSPQPTPPHVLRPSSL